MDAVVRWAQRVPCCVGLLSRFGVVQKSMQRLSVLGVQTGVAAAAKESGLTRAGVARISVRRDAADISMATDISIHSTMPSTMLDASQADRGASARSMTQSTHGTGPLFTSGGVPDVDLASLASLDSPKA